MALVAGGGGRPDKQELPKKEADLFRSIVKHYETKQYKKVSIISIPLAQG